MTFTRSATVSAILLATASSTAWASTWEIDPAHTTAQFTVRHMMMTDVRGVFEKIAGVINLDEKDLTHSTIDITIDATTISTREPKRDAHLKSADFFDVAKNPTVTFKSTKIENASKGKFKVTGDLTMHGITRSVTLDASALSPVGKDPYGRSVRAASATATINRKDWGLLWNKALETGGFLVGDEVKLQIDAEMDEKPAAPAAAVAPAKK